MEKLYVGCSLSHAPQEFRERVEGLKQTLRADFEVLEFIGLTAGTDTEVFCHDCSCVESADCFLAICDFPSLGLGYELALATQKGLPTLAVAHEDAVVSRMILGIDKPHFAFKRYATVEDVMPLTRKEFL